MFNFLFFLNFFLVCFKQRCVERTQKNVLTACADVFKTGVSSLKRDSMGGLYFTIKNYKKSLGWRRMEEVKITL